MAGGPRYGDSYVPREPKRCSSCREADAWWAHVCGQRYAGSWHRHLYHHGATGRGGAGHRPENGRGEIRRFDAPEGPGIGWISVLRVRSARGARRNYAVEVEADRSCYQPAGVAFAWIASGRLRRQGWTPDLGITPRQKR